MIVPKIEVRNLKHAPFASEETHCFEASVYVDGKRFCTASNDGHGGPDLYTPIKPNQTAKELHQEIERIGKQLPNEDGYDFDAHTRFEVAVGDAVNHALIAKDLKRDMKKKVVFIHDGKVLEINAGDQLEGRKQQIRTKYPGAQILNDLPIDEAVTEIRRY